MTGIIQATRKSASMGLLHINHPDIEDYIECKAKDKEISNFNLSVILDDAFMQSVTGESNPLYLQWYRHPELGDSLEKPIESKDIFNKMCKRIWDNGEPGVMFSGNIIRDYFTDLDDAHILANPCSEALLSYSDIKGDEWLELCVLGSINLPKWIRLSSDDKDRVVNVLVSMLNDIIDLQDYVTPLQEKGMKYINRKIGIGVAGLATVLAMDGLKYSSNEAYEFTKLVFEDIGELAKKKSEEMYKDVETPIGVEDTVKFLDKATQVYVEHKKCIEHNSPLRKLKRYNASLLSVAPTSTISSIFSDMNEEGCSYGIEPYFSLDPITVKTSYETIIKTDKIINYLGEEKAKELIECANELDWKSHIKIVEAYYNANKIGITQGCSKTVNFKNNVTVDDIKEAVIYCWKNKIKAISFYRDGSRDNQVLSTKDSYKDCKEVDENGRPMHINYTASPKRPNSLPCDIFHVKSQGAKWIVLISLFEGKPYELFAGLKEKIQIPKRYEKGSIKRTGHRYDLVLEEPNGDEDDDGMIIRDIPSMFDDKDFALVTRLTSMGLRHGVPLGYVSDQLLKTGTMDALNKAIARCLKAYMVEENASSENCPECKKKGTDSKLKYISGCLACPICQYSRCG
jgi:hypothetical protein